MTRGEVGHRPLLVDIITKVLFYTKDIKARPNSTVFDAFNYEHQNNVSPNIFTFLTKFESNKLNIELMSRQNYRKYLTEIYDRYWWSKLLESPKACTYSTIKNRVCLETYFGTMSETKHKIGLKLI